MAGNARYAVVSEESTSEVLTLRDLGPWYHYQTITNAAERIVAELHQQGQLPNGRRLLYYDSDGNRDELRHRDGRFLGFAPAR